MVIQRKTIVWKVLELGRKKSKNFHYLLFTKTLAKQVVKCRVNLFKGSVRECLCHDRVNIENNESKLFWRFKLH